MRFHRRMFLAGLATLGLAAMLFVTLGCGHQNPGEKPSDDPKTGDKPAAMTAKEKKIEAARAKLSPEDRALVDAQDICAVMSDHKLGSMGVPLKLTIQGQPVFICCKGCKGSAKDEPDATLKTVAELKAKNKKK